MENTGFPAICSNGKHLVQLENKFQIDDYRKSPETFICDECISALQYATDEYDDCDCECDCTECNCH